ncbi:MAG: hypothetical protein CL678_02110 [Bdellovibrionaceae bacterium]|nr:hypothetical protein [Pseudobdellovibrionaceae bacterium]|tara:strand:+ start:5330 stop:6409 length:1080 start_codon:yes stop_codon:yes gene_type:complete
MAYSQVNPATVLRDYLLASPKNQEWSFSKIFGLPAAPDEGVATGLAIDMSGTPGRLAGSIVVSSPRDLLGAAATFTVAKSVGAARDNSVAYDRLTRAFDCKQFDGKARREKQHLENGFHPREELHLADRAAYAVRIKKEIYTADFFTCLDAENKTKKGGWTELDWQAGLSGAALGSSNTTLEVLYAAVNSLKLTGACRPNYMICSEEVFQKLSVDPQILSRITTGTPAAGLASVIGMPVAPENHVKQVIKEHIGLDLCVASATHMPQAAGDVGQNTFIWPSNRVWIGERRESDMSIRPGAAPRVIGDAGSYVAVFTELFGSELDFEKAVKPQFVEAVVESHMDLVSLYPEKGAIIHNMF